MGDDERSGDERAEDEALTGDTQDVRPLEGERPSVLPVGDLGAFPVTAPRAVTPLDDDEQDGPIPPASLWAMKDRRHEQLLHLGHPSRLRAVAGTEDAAVYAIDDGARHCTVGRRVGATRDGCTYTLVARVPRAVWDDLAARRIDGRTAFLKGKEAALMGTGEEPGLANVFDVDAYRRPEDIPPEYLPPSPAIDFVEDLPSADH